MDIQWRQRNKKLDTFLYILLGMNKYLYSKTVFSSLHVPMCKTDNIGAQLFTETEASVQGTNLRTR